MLTLADFLMPVWADTPCELIGCRVRQRINAVAALLPGGMALNLFGFECPLDRTEPWSDFQISVGAAHGGRSMLSRRSLERLFPSDLMEHSVWRRIHQFADLWSDPDSPAHHGVDCVWLEFDMEGESTGYPVPSFFFGPTVSHGPDDPGQPEKPFMERRELAQWLIDTLAGSPMSESTRSTFQRCRQALPEKAVIFQVGLMYPRSTHKIRVCVRRLSPHGIVDYLDHLGWSPEKDGLRSVIEKYGHRFDAISLTFDVGDRIGSKIGLECYLRGKRHSPLEPYSSRVMAHLVAQGLCTREKADAFLQYPGVTPIFPTRMDESAGLIGGRRPIMAVRGLHHIKLVYEPDKGLTAKGYLWAGFRWAEAP